MKTQSREIIDYGRGPQLANSRLTVLDVFYYLHRGYDFEFIRQALPTLSHEEFAAIVEYVKGHRDELIESDRQAEEFIRQGIAEQKAKGLYHDIDESVPEVERLKAMTSRRQKEDNGGHAPR